MYEQLNQQAAAMALSGHLSAARLDGHGGVRLHSEQDKPGHELLQEKPCISNIPRHDGNAGTKVSSRREMRYSSA